MSVQTAFHSAIRALLRCWRAVSDRRSDLAFGIERIGLLSLRFPTVVACAAVALVVAGRVPDRLPDGDAYQKLVSRITSNEIVRGKLLSTDGDLALVVLALDPQAAQGDRLAAIVRLTT